MNESLEILISTRQNDIKHLSTIKLCGPTLELTIKATFTSLATQCRHQIENWVYDQRLSKKMNKMS